MNVTQLIDQVMARDDNIDETSADNSERRTRHLEYLREVEAEVWWRRDWKWKNKRGTVTVPAGQGYVSVPSDFASLGEYGGVFYPTTGSADGRKLEEVPEQVIMELRESGAATGPPEYFALFGQDASTYLTYIQIPLNSGAVTLVLWYQPNPPTIDEAANVNAIKAIPEKYHQLVLVPGLRSKARESKGDARWQTQLAAYQSGLRFMQMEENRFKGNKSRQTPSFFGHPRY